MCYAVAFGTYGDDDETILILDAVIKAVLHARKKEKKNGNDGDDDDDGDGDDAFIAFDSNFVRLYQLNRKYAVTIIIGITIIAIIIIVHIISVT